jgi:hypothetical protein
MVYVVHEKYFLGWYDVARKEHFWRHWDKYFPHFENIPGHILFLQRCIDTYYFFPILLFVVLSLYVSAIFNKTTNIKAPLWKLGLIVGFCFSYLLLNHINDPNTPFLFYSEVNYMGLAIPLLIPLGFDFLPKISSLKLLGYVTGIVVLIRLITIYNASDELKMRHAWMTKMMHNSSVKKNYIQSNSTIRDLLIQTWSVPEESLLLSSLPNKTNSSTILVMRSDYKYKAEIDSFHLFLRSYSVQPLIELNNKYFNLENGLYEEVKWEDE